MQNSSFGKLELSLLNLFRWAIISSMFLLIVSVVVLLGVGLFNLTYSPNSPKPAESAPPPSISGMDFLHSMNPPAEKKAAASSAVPTALAPDSNEALFRAQAEKLWQHVNKYQVDCSITSPLNKADFVDTLRQSPLKSVLESRGPDFPASQDIFVKETLGNKDVIKLCRSGKTGLFFSSIEFHRSNWDRQVQQAKYFEAKERVRVAEFEAVEVRKAVEKKAMAYEALRGAVIGFGFFMMVALLLIFARIESNLRGLNIKSN